MVREINLGGVIVNDDSDCYVIAEIGHNHGGDLKTALKMVKVALDCGADAVKFQKRDNKVLFTADAYYRTYVNENSYGTTYGQHREALEFNSDEYKELIAYCKHIGVTMFATAFDFNSVDFLVRLEVPMLKAASGDLKNTPLLSYMAKTNLPIIMSTGGGDIVDVDRAVNAIMPFNDKLCILQCTAAYPPLAEEMNLRVIETYRKIYEHNVIGLSSHDNGILMPVIAYMLGSRVIEKHFTLNHTMKGTDHAFSLEPPGFTKMVRDLRRTKIALGDGIKRMYDSEIAPIGKMGKSIVAAVPIRANDKILRGMLALKSPCTGLDPYWMDEIVGKTSTRDIAVDEPIFFSDLNEVDKGEVKNLPL